MKFALAALSLPRRVHEDRSALEAVGILARAVL